MKREAKPNWDELFEVAAAQDGYFTTKQAAAVGYSSQLLVKHIRAGRILRVRRGVYRLVHFPAGEHEDLVVAWLWSEQAGVVSQATALALHGLSDVLPAQIHLTLPGAWSVRRFRTPAGLVLHFSDVAADERSWFGAVPTTDTKRTLKDCVVSGLAPDLLRQAAREAQHRGLVSADELGDVIVALEPFGGLSEWK